MHATYKNALMWTLYGALFLLLTVVQTVIFGRTLFFGVKLSLIPVCVACVAMHCGAENGALYGLCCGTFWCFTGTGGGALHIALLTICGAIIGYLCDRYLIRQFVSALLMCLLALLICQSVLFLFQCYLGAVGLHGILQLPIQIGLSLAACPLLYLCAWAIRKVGA